MGLFDGSMVGITVIITGDKEGLGVCFPLGFLLGSLLGFLVGILESKVGTRDVIRKI